MHNSNKIPIFASDNLNNNILNTGGNGKQRHKIMKAFIDITPKSHKNGQIFINDQVKDMNDCYKWFELNMDYLKKVAKRKSIEYVKLYVKEQYNVIYEYTI